MGLPHRPYTIIYTTICTALKNKQKSNNAQHLITGIQHKSFLILMSFYSKIMCYFMSTLIFEIN